MKKECELKYKIEEKKELNALLKNLKDTGFKFVEKRREKDFIPDRKNFPCRKSSILLRFRQINTPTKQDILLTLKEKIYRGEYKIDDETEFLFSKINQKDFKKINETLKKSTGHTLPRSILSEKNLDALQKRLQEIGWTEIRALNEKVRMYFTNDFVNITLDEFPEPVGLFCELEAETPALITAMAEKLSLSKKNLVTLDYGEIILSKKEGSEKDRRTLILRWDKPEKKYTIFHTGPVEPLFLKTNELGFMIAHRDEVFRSLYEISRQILTQILTDYSTFYDSILFPGTGTLANETFWNSLKKTNVLVLVQGYFGLLLAETIERAGHEITIVKSIPDLKKKIYSKQFNWLAIVHHETSIGFVNNIDKIGEITKKSDTHFFVDGISSVGIENINCFLHSIDVISGTSGKGFAAFPGVAFLTMDREILYGNIWRNFNGSTSISENLTMHKRNMCLHTPSPFTFELFYRSLDYFKYNKDFLNIKRFENLTRIIRSFQKKGFRIFTKKNHQSNTTATVKFSSEQMRQDFVNKAASQNFSLYVPRSVKNSIQISVNGNISEMEINNFCKFIKQYKIT